MEGAADICTYFDSGKGSPELASGRESAGEGTAGRVSVASCLPAAILPASLPRCTTQISSEPNFTDCLSPRVRVGSLSQNYE
jgi:hypothetical protein